MKNEDEVVNEYLKTLDIVTYKSNLGNIPKGLEKGMEEIRLRYGDDEIEKYTTSFLDAKLTILMWVLDNKTNISNNNKMRFIIS